ncbi:MAG: hypothetical protein WCD38_04305 [Candidatus Tumulicola sp.]
MKVLPIALALAVPLVAGCGQALNQSSLPSGAQALVSAPNVRAHPDNCNIKDVFTRSAVTSFLKVTTCGGFIGRLYYGPGTTGGLKFTTQGFTSNPGGVPVPTGETPVLFIQLHVLPQDPAPASFTAPVVPPNSNRSRFTGVPIGNTYKFYAYDNSFTLIAGFPINLGSPTGGGTLFFSTSPWSPLPLLGTVPVGNNVWFELTKP